MPSSSHRMPPNDIAATTDCASLLGAEASAKPPAIASEKMPSVGTPEMSLVAFTARRGMSICRGAPSGRPSSACGTSRETTNGCPSRSVASRAPDSTRNCTTSMPTATKCARSAARPIDVRTVILSVIGSAA